MFRILIITSNYWPEPTGISIYTTDLAECLESHGFEISVLTSLPHYPWWKVPLEYRHLREGVSEHHGIQVFRAEHLIPSEMNAFKRARFEFSIWKNLNRVSKVLGNNKFDLVISFIPTVAAGLVGCNLARKFDIPFGLIVQDLSSSGAKQSGLYGGRLVSKIAYVIEGSLLNQATKIAVVSPEMRDSMISLGISSRKISLIPNYSVPKREHRKKLYSRSRFGWAKDDFVVVHTGNMGAKQGLENVIEASKLLGQNLKIKIYLIGHGNRESELKNLAKSVDNVDILPAVPANEYSALLAAADLLLVNERPSLMDMSLPSKLTSYLFSGRPIIAAVPRNGATWNYLNGIAELVEAGRPEELASAIKKLMFNPGRQKELARLGFEFAKLNLDAESGRAKYITWVSGLIPSQ